MTIPLWLEMRRKERIVGRFEINMYDLAQTTIDRLEQEGETQ